MTTSAGRANRGEAVSEGRDGQPVADAGEPAPADAPARSLPLLAWDAPLYCHAPADVPFDPRRLDEPDDGDRWSGPDERTIYLASDAGVAIAELARHHAPGTARVERRIMRLTTGRDGLKGLVDLRDPAVLAILGGPGEPCRFLDRPSARRMAAGVRRDPGHLGLIVPSMAFLDRPERCNLVLFADRLPVPLDRLLAAWSEVARIAVGGP